MNTQAISGRATALGIGLSLTLLVAGCATQPYGEDTRDRMDEILEESLRAAEDARRARTPEDVDRVLDGEDERSWATPPPDAEEERFDVSVRELPAENFFLSLVEDTDYNMMVHPDVTGTITLNLANVTIPEVMEAVRDLYGYEFREQAGGYMVLPAGLQTRTFHIDYLTIQREGRSSTRVTSGQVSQDPMARMGGARGGTGRGFGAGTQPGTGQDQTLGTLIETESKSDFWADITETLEAIIGDEEGRKVIVNAHSGAVAIRAMPDELREIEQFLSRLQESIGRQVVLEAKILEVVLSDEFRSGINWSAVWSDADDAAVIGQRSGPDLFEDGHTGDRGTPRSLEPGQPLDGFTAEEFGGTFAAALNIGDDFSAFIELLEGQGETRVLSSPRVSTVNNQKAVIKVGEDQFFVTGVASGGALGVGGAATTQRNVQLTPFFSGIALDVTPQINEGGEVTLHIHPTVSEVTDDRKELTVAGETDILPLARSDVRESDSIVRASSGQIVVIGGLMQTRMEDESFSTPILGDIPVLGNLFRQTRQREAKTELVILLRPIVVEDGETWDGMTREYQEDIRDMRRGTTGRR